MTLPEFAFAPYRLSGVVIGCLMNHGPALAALGDAVGLPPYKAAPKAPVLYVKPRNTLAGDGAVVAVPADVPALELGATLGLVMARSACRVSEPEALSHVAGALIVADISIPHSSFYRPSVRLKARDGFCPMGPTVVPLSRLASPDALGVRVHVDGALVHSSSTGDRLRGAARLISEVSAFMTLSPGDVLMLGVAHGAPLLHAGQSAAIEIDGLGRLHLRLAHEEALA